MAYDHQVYYEVGAAARLAKISPHTLRTWERRSFITAEHRSDSGRRQYSRSQVNRLILMARLTHLGEKIGNLNELSDMELQQRLDEHERVRGIQRDSKLSTISVTAFDPQTYRRLSPLSPRINAQLLDLNDLPESQKWQHSTLVLLEASTSLESLLHTATTVRKHWPDTPIAVLYEFISREHLHRLSQEGFFLIRWPLQREQFEHYLFKAAGQSSLPSAASLDAAEESGYRNRLFDNHQLMVIANANTEIKCECPDHLSALITNLVAFEDYCKRCEVANEEDARVHQHLGVEVSIARRRVEEALRFLCEADNIPIPPPQSE